jgi:tRNA threonylcarbamoyladenosine biosynthesis protein TsaB
MNINENGSGHVPLILSVETSGRLGSVAIAAGNDLLGEKTFSGPMKHSLELFPVIRGLLAEFDKKPEQIEHIYISSGPGSFTGLRISVTLAKILHLAESKVKIVAVDTLDVIAANAFELLRNKAGDVPAIAAILDAKRGEFFIALYENKDDQWKKTVEDRLMSATEFLDNFSGRFKNIWLSGEGLVYYKDLFTSDVVDFFEESCWYPKASKVHLLGWEKAQREEFSDVMMLEPHYIRRPEIGKKKGSGSF